jgi:branched-chain amino acid transport system permease protein
MIWGQTLVNGILLGGLYALVAVGLSLVWGITNILNFAHGGMIMLGAYITFWLFQLYGVDPFLSVPISMAAMFVFGLVVHRVLLTRVLRRADFVFLVLLLTFALEMFMANGAALLWTADFRSVRASYSGTSFALGPVLVSVVDLAVLGVAILLIGLLWLYLMRTRSGQAILATGLDPEAAHLVGIEVGRVYALTFAIGSALAGAAGSLVATLTAINPYFGGAYTFRAALVAILGGLGSIPGILLGGLVVGMAETLGSVLIAPVYRLFVSFVLLVVILILRPTGLLGGAFFGQLEHEG